MTRILLTGGSGFLGSALARHWARAGADLHVLLRPSSSRSRLADVLDRAELHQASGADEAADVLREVRPDVVVHTACVYGRAGEHPRRIFDTNMGLGMALLQAILDGDRRVSFINTGSVLAPDVSLYALSKQQFSDWGAQLAARLPERLRFVDLKLQHMYGPGDDRSKFTTHVLHACHADEPVLRLTAGEQERDLVHIDDVVSAYEQVLAHAGELPAFDAIEVGSGEAPSIRSFVELVHRLTCSSTHLDFGAIGYRPNEAMRCVADTSRLRAMGWRPCHDLASGLQDTLSKEFPT